MANNDGHIPSDEQIKKFLHQKAQQARELGLKIESLRQEALGILEYSTNEESENL